MAPTVKPVPSSGTNRAVGKSYSPLRMSVTRVILGDGSGVAALSTILSVPIGTAVAQLLRGRGRRSFVYSRGGFFFSLSSPTSANGTQSGIGLCPVVHRMMVGRLTPKASASV